MEKRSLKAFFLSEFPSRNQTSFKHTMYLLVCLLGRYWHRLAYALNDFYPKTELKFVISKCVLFAKCVTHSQESQK